MVRGVSVEKREYWKRVAVDAPATVQSGSRRVQVRVVNVSAGGMALETESGVELDRFVRVSAKLLPDARTADLDGIVNRRERLGETTRWGLEFVNPSPACLALIEDCIRQLGGASGEDEGLSVVAGGGPAEAAVFGNEQDGELRGLYESALRSLDF